VVGSSVVPLCPCCQAGDCPFPKAGSTRRCSLFGTTRCELTKVEKVLHRGSELYSTGEFCYAELSYDKAIELDPLDWRGHFGKVVSVQAQGKPFKAFQACRRGVEKLPDDTTMKELEATVRDAYQASKSRPAEPAVATTAMEASDCPGSIASPEAIEAATAPRNFTGRVPTKEERVERKEMMLDIFREQWARIGKAKESMGYADYSKEQQQMLKIEGGHRPMARPDGVALPKDFRDPIGTVTSEHLTKYYNCNCKRLLISIHGDIFDVSDRPDKYGTNAPYYYFAGCDITWGLVTGNDTDQIVNMFFDLFKMDEAEMSKKMQCLCSWTGFYEFEYGKRVGRLAEFEAEHELPAPPVHNAEECVVQ